MPRISYVIQHALIIIVLSGDRETLNVTLIAIFMLLTFPCLSMISFYWWLRLLVAVLSQTLTILRTWSLSVITFYSWVDSLFSIDHVKMGEGDTNLFPWLGPFGFPDAAHITTSPSGYCHQSFKCWDIRKVWWWESIGVYLLRTRRRQTISVT